MVNDDRSDLGESGGTLVTCEQYVFNDWERVDVPPYEIRYPRTSDDRDPADVAWNEEYLGEHMPDAPSVAFESIGIGGESVGEPGVRVLGRDSYMANVLRSEDDVQALFTRETMSPTAVERLDAFDFDDAVLVFVGSAVTNHGSHGWARVEPIDGGVHLHGYHIKPKIVMGTHMSCSLLAIDRPAAEVERARVSLTVDGCSRVHVVADESSVRLMKGFATNEYGELVDLDVTVRADDGAVRIDDRVRVPPTADRLDLGYVAEAGSTVTVAATVDALGIETVERCRLDSPLCLRLSSDGELVVGPADSS